MGPHFQQPGKDELYEQLWEYQLLNPQLIVVPPEESDGGMWQVSLPSSSCLGFDSLSGLLRCLNSVSSLRQPDDD